MKFSNIFTAYKSTLLGVAITGLTALAQALMNGPVNWKAIGVAFAVNCILALTDILKEAQKKG